MSLRTIYRDAATLMALGVPLEGEAGLGYVLKPGFFLPPLTLDEDEVDAVILGLRLVARRGDAALREAAANALAKIVAMLPPGLEDAVATGGLMAGPGCVVTGSPLGLLRDALKSEEKLVLRYTDKLGTPSQRVVWPVAIGFFDGADVLVAWCETRRDFRHFRLDRISEVAPSGTRYPKPRRILIADWRVSQGIEDLI